MRNERSASLDGIAQRGLQFGLAIDAAHAFAAAAGDGFEEHRIPVRAAELAGLVESHAVVRARRDRGSGRHRGAARGGLRAHHAHGIGGRADENDAGILAGRGEIGVLAEEAVAGMDRLGAVFLGGVENPVDPQVAFGGRRGADVLRLVGHADVQRCAVGIGIDGHRSDAHFAQGADDADGDLAPVGDQYLAEHATEM